MRLVLTKESREDLFLLLKDKYNVRTFKGLANKMQIPNKTLQTWRLGERSIPSEIIPICVNSLTVLERKPDNWGMIKGGLIGGKRSVESMKRRLGKEGYQKMKENIGKKAMRALREKYGSNLAKRAIQGRINKRIKKVKK
ncbi:MAG: hypothetical protein AABX12_02860 [Nanoarchaeota archaeon]